MDEQTNPAPPQIIVRSGATVQQVLDMLGEHIAGGLDPQTPIIGYDESAIAKLSTEPIMLDLDALMPRVIAWITLAGKKYPLFHPQSLPPADLVELLAVQQKLPTMSDSEQQDFIEDKIVKLSITRKWLADGTVEETPGLSLAQIKPLPFEAKSKLYLAMTGVEIRAASPALEAIEQAHSDPSAAVPQ